mgnify:CR=1 FL=1
MVIRPLDPQRDEEIKLVAVRMRRTLEEVLGARGRTLYTLDWLQERVRHHLDQDIGQVFLAEVDGSVVAHTIVRDERDDLGRFGLFSTTWVQPEHRRSSIATRLLEAGHSWMAARGLIRSATDTAVDNAGLIRLFQAHGYRVSHTEDRMVRLSR